MTAHDDHFRFRPNSTAAPGEIAEACRALPLRAHCRVHESMSGLGRRRAWRSIAARRMAVTIGTLVMS